MSHLLPDMIDKSLPSVISAKLLFRRAAAPSLPLLLLLIVLLTTGLPQPVSSFTAAVYGVSQTYQDKFYSRRNCLTAAESTFAEKGGCNCENVLYREKKGVRVFEYNNSSIIIVNFLPEAKVKFLRREFTSYPD